MRGWLVAVLAMASASCIQSGVVPCGDGVICPAGNTCEAGRCVDQAQRDACAGLETRDPCVLRGLPGECRGGVCEPTYCGDGIKQPGEVCDGDDLGDETCMSLHYYGETTGLACRADCTFDESGCVGACGDGIKNGEELCDGDDLGTPAATCVTAGFYDAPGLACSPFCTYDVSMCEGTCGDDIPNGGELCDGAAPDETCFDVGFDAGRLDCTSACGYSLTGCGRAGWHFLANTPARSSLSTSPYRVHASSRTDVWAVASESKAIHFNGSQWTEMTVGSADLQSVWTAGPSNAWASDSSGALWHWNGSAWAADAGTNVPSGVHAVWGTSATDVWVVTSSAGVHRWNGTTWAPVGSVTETNLDVIHGSSSSDVWISNGAIVRHWNGTAWSPADTVGASANVNALLALGPNDAWAVGDDGGKAIRSHWNGASWTMSPKFGTTTFISVAGSASNDVWVSGPTTTSGITLVEHWDGHTWLRVESLTDVSLFELDPGTIYGATLSTINELSGLVYATNDAGNNIFALNDLFSTQDDYIFAKAGVNGGGIGWFDRTNWLNTTLPDGSSLAAVWGITGNGTWIVSGFGTPYRYNGISSFTAGTFNPASGPAIPTGAMWGSSSSDIWYAGYTGSGTQQAAIRHFNGTDWSTRNITPALPANILIKRISGSGPDDVWVLTVDKRLFRWTGTWSELTNLPPPTQIEDMVVAGPNNVILTGGHKAHHGNASGWIEDTLPNAATTPIHLVASGPDWVFGASSTEVFHYDGVRWSQIAYPGVASSLIVGLGLAPNRLDIGYAPGNATAVRGLVITRPWRCRATETGYCGDAMDNDCDGLIDTRDSDCP